MIWDSPRSTLFEDLTEFIVIRYPQDYLVFAEKHPDRSEPEPITIALGERVHRVFCAFKPSAAG
jgi:hypothetical protein